MTRNNARDTTWFPSDVSIVAVDSAWHTKRPRGRKRKFITDLMGAGEANAARTSTTTTATRGSMGNCGISACRCAFSYLREIPRARVYGTKAPRRPYSLPRGFEIGSRFPLVSAITVEITGDSISRWMAATTRGVAMFPRAYGIYVPT